MDQISEHEYVLSRFQFTWIVRLKLRSHHFRGPCEGSIWDGVDIRPEQLDRYNTPCSQCGHE